MDLQLWQSTAMKMLVKSIATVRAMVSPLQDGLNGLCLTSLVADGSSKYENLELATDIEASVMI